MDDKKRTENIRGEVLDYDPESNTITLKLIDEIDIRAIQKLMINGKYYTYLDFFDKRNISDAQRNYFYALMGDFSNHTGYLKSEAEEAFKEAFMDKYDLPDVPSVSRNGITKTMARKLLQHILDFFIEQEIPFKDKQFYLAEDESELYYALTMNRICFVCGEEHSHLHHYDAVQRGRNRNKIDHTKHRFMMLCANHHQEAHNLGNKEFCSKYHLKPIKLDEKSLRELGIRGDYTK